jgi:BMFP domain-containing protein YqiC
MEKINSHKEMLLEARKELENLRQTISLLKIQICAVQISK